MIVRLSSASSSRSPSCSDGHSNDRSAQTTDLRAAIAADDSSVSVQSFRMSKEQFCAVARDFPLRQAKSAERLKLSYTLASCLRTRRRWLCAAGTCMLVLLTLAAVPTGQLDTHLKVAHAAGLGCRRNPISAIRQGDRVPLRCFRAESVDICMHKENREVATRRSPRADSRVCRSVLKERFSEEISCPQSGHHVLISQQ